MAVMNGFRKELLDKILGVNGHLLIQPLESPLTDWQQVADRVGQAEGVRLAAPIVEGQALASSPFNASGVLVRGMRASDLGKLRSIASNIKQGTLEGFDQGQGVVIGRRLADQLSLRAGDKLTLVAPRGAVTPMGTTPRIKSYKIAAVFEIGMSEYDTAFVFMPMPEAQAYFNRAGDVTAIEVYVDNPDRVDRYRTLVTQAAGRPIFVIDWRQRNATFFNALQVERNVMFLILTLIVLVAALNIISGLIMLVKDKGPDIAILRTMGATQGSIMRIFLITGAAIGVVGTITGFLVGTLVCMNVESIRQFISWLTATELFSPELYFLSKLAGRYGRRGDDGGGGDGACRCRSWPRSIRRGVQRASIRSRRCAMNEMPQPATVAAREAEAKPVVFLHGVRRSYRQGEATLDILKGAELALWPGQSVALVAPSGAGKSTLLHIAGLLEHPDGGEVFVDEIATSKLCRRRAHPHPPYRDRFRLPVPSPAAGILGDRERHPAANDSRACRAARPRKRATELLDLSRPQGSLDPSPRRTVGRRAAAGRNRACGRQCAADSAGGRADRQSRSPYRRARLRHAHPARAGFGPRRSGCHPQHGDRRSHGPSRDAARRLGGGVGLATRPGRRQIDAFLIRQRKLL